MPKSPAFVARFLFLNVNFLLMTPLRFIIVLITPNSENNPLFLTAFMFQIPNTTY